MPYYKTVNILFTRFPLESLLGGAEVQTLSLMQGLSTREHTVSFLGSCPILFAEAPKDGVATTMLDIGPPPVSKRHALSFVWRKYSMKKCMEEALESMNDVPDILCMLSLSEKILLTPLALQKGIKVVWIEHDSVGRWLKGNPWLSVVRKLSARVTTVCVSELSAQMYRDLGYSNVLCIPNGVALPQYSAPSAKGTNITVGCIARLSPEKGVHVLLEAVEHMPRVHVLINGRGPQKIKKSETVELIDRVHDINDIYRKIDVLVLPSVENDPFGLVVAEAMLRGIPIICTGACGISKYLHSGEDGLVVKAGSVIALRDAIEMMQDPETRNRLSENGKNTARKHFTLERMVDQYIDVFSM